MTDTTEIETFLTKDAIFRADDRKTETVAVPEWGGSVRVRALTGTERDDYIGSLQIMNPKTRTPQPNNRDASAKLVALSVVDLQGERMFSNLEVKALGAKSGGALSRIVDVAERLSGLTAKADKDAEGNSESTESDGSTSSPPEPQDSPSVSG